MVDLEEFKKHVRAKLKEAKDKFGFDRNVDIRFDAKGRCAGYAGYNGNYFYLRFNLEAIEKDWEYMVEGNIPHEVAHLVCYQFPHLGKGHDRGWKAVCRALGGNSQRCHSIDLTPAKKRTIKNYIYIVNGKEHILKIKYHNLIQRYAKAGIRSPISSKLTGARIEANMFKETRIVR